MNEDAYELYEIAEDWELECILDALTDAIFYPEDASSPPRYATICLIDDKPTIIGKSGDSADNRAWEIMTCFRLFMVMIKPDQRRDGNWDTKVLSNEQNERLINEMVLIYGV